MRSLLLEISIPTLKPIKQAVSLGFRRAYEHFFKMAELSNQEIQLALLIEQPGNDSGFCAIRVVPERLGQFYKFSLLHSGQCRL